MPIERPSSLAAIDLRSLAAFRIALGTLLIWDQFHALRDAAIFFSDAGALPRTLLLSGFLGDPSHWSLHIMGGSVVVQTLLMLVAMLAGLAVCLGWRTRWSLLIAWVLTVSLQNRNPFVLYGGDIVLRMMTFWSLFLPLGAVWSLDVKKESSPPANPHLSIASLAALVQVALIYWFTAALKFGNDWTRDGTAVYNVLMADQFVQTPGLWLLPHADLCRMLTFGIWWLELLGPFIAFVPWRSAALRLLVIAAMMILHLGLALCLRIGCFPTVMMSLWLLFLPASSWDWLANRIPNLALAFTPRTDPTWKPCLILRESFCALCLFIVLIWNLSTLRPERWNPWLIAPVRTLANLLRLDQNWTMFAPTSATDDGWLILDAELYDGTHIDLLRKGQPLDFKKPNRISAEYPDWKWHKFEVHLVADQNKPLRTTFSDHLAREWSRKNPKVRRWTLWFMREQTLPNYQILPIQKVELAKNQMFIAPP